MPIESYSIIETLMRRDGLSKEEAETQVLAAYKDLKNRLDEDEDVFYICEEWFGLEPDYNIDLVDTGMRLERRKRNDKI